MATITTTTDGLRTLGFRLDPDTLRALLKDATKRHLSPMQTCEQLVTAERRERDARNLTSRTRAATLEVFKPLDRFDWSWPRKLDRQLYDQLTSLDFIGQGQNVLFRGPAGAGKTTLAKNLGLLALQAGHTVRFSTLAATLADLLKQESVPALERRIRRYTAPALWICDEIGFIPCDNRSADLLYNIISRRHEKCATIITTNLSFKKWSTVFPGAACVSALVDRFVQHCHVLDIDADSWREKEAREFVKSPKSKKPRNSHSKRKR
jgi:DNA replication protein DnaC